MHNADIIGVRIIFLSGNDCSSRLACILSCLLTLKLSVKFKFLSEEYTGFGCVLNIYVHLTNYIVVKIG